MKALVIVATIGLSSMMFSCRTGKEVISNDELPDQTVLEETTTEETQPERLVGVVAVVDDCGAIIRVVQGDVERSYLPINLEEKFRVPGMKLRFSYAIVDEKLKGECGFYQQISVSEVTILR